MRTFCLILLPALVCAQVGVLLNSQNGISVSTAGYDAPYFIRGLPFSARQTSLRTLPNGIHQTYPETRQYRDSEGRTRKEVQHGSPATLIVEIFDSVAGFSYVLDPETHTAHKLKLAAKVLAIPKIPIPCSSAPASTTTGPSGQVSKSESLGSKTINGVSACGMKTTTTYPPGSYQKNENPVSTTYEAWKPVEPLLLDVLSNRTEIDGSKTTREAVDLSFKEPDPALFQIPGDYRVVEETGPYSFPLPNRQIEPPPVKSMTALTGMPYSAELTLADKTISLMYRDSLGRTRRESTSLPEGSVDIFDPIAGFRYVLTPFIKTAKRSPVKVTTLPAGLQQLPRPPSSVEHASADGTTSKTEFLGTKMVDGIETFGTMMTLTNPPGTRMGNDKQIVATYESWIAPKLGIAMTMKTSGPIVSLTTILKNMKFTEPDPSLFRVPEGYQIVDAPQ